MSTEMKDTLTITLVGMVAVFIVLIVLSYCFTAMKLLSSDKRAKAKVAAQPVATQEQMEPDAATDVEDKDELSAVISAALSAYLGDGQMVSSLRRIEDAAVWSKAGRRDRMVSGVNAVPARTPANP